MTLSDIGACAQIAHRHAAILAIDSTLATPVLTHPLELDADIVMHSATKYLGGHSDLIGGALVVGQRGLYDERVFHSERDRCRSWPLGLLPAVAGAEDAGLAPCVSTVAVRCD